MKTIAVKLILQLAVFLATFFATAQDITGSWNGTLKVQGQELPLTFNISEKDGAYTSTMDSPAQGAMGIPTDKTSFENNVLIIELNQFQIRYKATFEDNILKGAFFQGGMPMTLDLTKGKKVGNMRPQEPKAPFSYASEEVQFTNEKAGNIKLSGTLTLPKNVENPPVAILISGSGPQDRNSQLLGHKPFLVLSDHLTKKGIAVLRYDDRGFAKSEGDFSAATSFDFADDVEAAIAYLQTRKDVVDTNKIGLIGHSEGGLIAPIVASRNDNVAFCVLLAGPGVSGKEILMTQSKRGQELEGENAEAIEKAQEISSKIYNLILNKKDANIDNQLKGLFQEMRALSPKMKRELSDQVITQQIKMLQSPWMTAFMAHDPKPYLEKINCPTLAVNGEKDFQVMPDLNLGAIEKALQGKKDVTIHEFNNLNHLFQTSETGAFDEYATIKETFAPVALEYISNWISERF